MPEPGAPLLLAVPSAVEGRAILRHCPPGAEILRCGVGPSAAGRLAARLARGSAAGVLVVGTAGGLDPGLAPGALLLPAELRLAGGERLRLPADWHAAVRSGLAPLAVATGPLVSSRSAVGDPAARQRLRERSGALAVDMESYWLAQAAAAAGVPLLVLRAVADPAAAQLPPPLLAALTADGGLRWQALLACWRPALWPGLWRLRRDFRRAAASLRVALAKDATALFPPRA